MTRTAIISSETTNIEKPKAISNKVKENDWSNRLAIKLRQLRWLPFLLAVFGIVLAAVSVIYGLTAEMTYVYYRYSSLRVLPTSGLFFTIFGSLAFSGMTLTSFVLGDRETLQECPQPFSFISENFLTRMGFWPSFVAYSATVAIALMSQVALTGDVFSLPAIDWLSGYDYYSGMGTVFITLTYPLLLCFSSALLIGSSWLLPQIENKDIILLPPTNNDEAESDGKGEIIELVDYIAHDKEALCPVCSHQIDEEPCLCPRCHTPHHKDCWEYSEGCAIFGCDEKGWRKNDVAAVDDKAIQNAVNNWALSYRAHWGLLCLSVAGIVFYCLGSFFPSIYSSGVLGHLIWIGQSLRFFGSTGAALALFAYLAMLFVHSLIERALQSKLHLPALPREESRRVVDSLDKTQTGERLTSFFIGTIVSFLTIIFIFGSVALLFPEQWLSCYPLSESVGMASLLFCFIAALYKASRVRLAYVQSVQNRLAASLKKGS